jgi:hypothetical protein
MIYYKYTIHWNRLCHLYNEQEVGQLTHRRLAKLFGGTNVMICLNQTIPITLDKINKKYRPLYDKHFKHIIALEDLLEGYKFSKGKL